MSLYTTCGQWSIYPYFSIYTPAQNSKDNPLLNGPSEFLMTDNVVPTL